MSVYLGLDIGGTKLLAAAADRDGRILRRVRQDTPVPLAEGLDLLRRMAREVADGEPVLAAGAAAGGPLDWETGIVSPLHQPQWRGVPLKAVMEEELGAPFAVDVDTNVAALGEYRFGNTGAERLVYLTLSTGMGGGLLIDGAIYRGFRGAHPEVGHQAIAYRGSFAGPVVCECGAEGCLEALVSGNAIRRLYGRSAEELTGAQWEEVGCNLGQGLRNIATAYAPDVIALGGGVAVGGGERLLEPAIRTMKQGLRLVPPPDVRLSALGYDTALRGAVALAMTLA
jgi:predicted NBD/HSP70 family sugar kinase